MHDMGDNAQEQTRADAGFCSASRLAAGAAILAACGGEDRRDDRAHQRRCTYWHEQHRMWVRRRRPPQAASARRWLVAATPAAGSDDRPGGAEQRHGDHGRLVCGPRHLRLLADAGRCLQQGEQEPIQINYQEQGATTQDLHDKFVAVAGAKDASVRHRLRWTCRMCRSSRQQAGRSPWKTP